MILPTRLLVLSPAPGGGMGRGPEAPGWARGTARWAGGHARPAAGTEHPLNHRREAWGRPRPATGRMELAVVHKMKCENSYREISFTVVQ